MTAARVFTPTASAVYLAPLGQDGEAAQWQPIGMVADGAFVDADLWVDDIEPEPVDPVGPVTFSVDMLDVDEATLRTMGLLPEPPTARERAGHLVGLGLIRLVVAWWLLRRWFGW